MQDITFLYTLMPYLEIQLVLTGIQQRGLKYADVLTIGEADSMTIDNVDLR